MTARPDNVHGGDRATFESPKTCASCLHPHHPYNVCARRCGDTVWQCYCTGSVATEDLRAQYAECSRLGLRG